MQAGNIQWRLHLIELFIVTLGIFMGFGLNSCNETRKEKKQVRLYLEGIKAELIANKKELLEVHPYHLDLLQQLRDTPLETTLTLSPGELASSAWRLAENSLFKKHVDPDVYRELSAVYKWHDLVIEASSQASQLMGEVNVLGTFYVLPTLDMGLDEAMEQELAISLKQGWIPIFESWTSYEEDYLKQIDEALGLLE